MTTAHITGYHRKEFRFVSFVELVKLATGKDLLAVKTQADGLLNGKPFDLTFPDYESAKRFASLASAIGAIVDIDDDKPSISTL